MAVEVVHSLHSIIPTTSISHPYYIVFSSCTFSPVSPLSPPPIYTFTMNRSLRILRPQTYALPYRPRPAGLPSNLLRPVAPTSSPAGAKISQYLTFMRSYASGPGSSAENDKKYVEKQKATPGAKEEVCLVSRDLRILMY